jgi:hypothetical protein
VKVVKGVDIFNDGAYGSTDTISIPFGIYISWRRVNIRLKTPRSPILSLDDDFIPSGHGGRATFVWVLVFSNMPIKTLMILAI